MSANAEQAVIGALMLIDLTSDPADKVFSMLRASSFSDGEHQLIYLAIQRLAERGGYADVLTVGEECKKDKRFRADLEDYLVELVQNTPTAENVVGYAEVVRQAAIQRFATSKLNEALAIVSDPYAGDVYQRIGIAEELLAAIQERGLRNKAGGLVHAKEIGKSWLPQVSERVEHGVQRGFTLGIEALDRLLLPKRIPPGSLIVIGARPKSGKEQPLDANILMADGLWKTMGDIAIGDSVASVDGSASKVVGIFPQGVKDVYAVEFSDGRVAECGLDHLWAVRSSRFAGGEKVVSTGELESLLAKSRYKSRISIPSLSGDFGETNDIGVDPWLLGALLGDGCLGGRTPKISCSEEYIINRVSSCLPDGVVMSKDSGVDYRLSAAKRGSNNLTKALKDLGAYGCGSHSKKIPSVVFSANKSVREGVLSGLLETDGWVEKRGSLMFSSSSKELSDGVERLAWSLGGVARRSVKTDVKYSYKGETRTGRDAYTVTIRLPNLLSIINSPRLLKNIKPEQKKTSSPVVVSVRKVREAECQCIMVDHPQHLYATDNYIVTHNTALMAKIIDHFACDRKETVAVFSLEMPNQQIYERMITGAAKVDPEMFYRPAKNADDWSAVTDAAGRYNRAELYFDDTPGVSMAHIRREVRKLNMRSPVKLVAVDYLTLMQAQKADRNDLAYGEITKSLKNMAKEIDGVVLLLTQLSRKLEDRADKRPLPSDSRDTGQIEQDCDLWIGLYKEAVYNTDAPSETITEAIVRLNRHGKAGTVYIDAVHGAIQEVDQDWAKELMARPEKTGPRRVKA